jgi:hypothetical protein
LAPQFNEQQSVGAVQGVPWPEHLTTVEPQVWLLGSQVPEQHVAPVEHGSLKTPHETVPSDPPASVETEASWAEPADPPVPLPAAPPPPPPEPPTDASALASMPLPPAPDVAPPVPLVPPPDPVEPPLVPTVVPDEPPRPPLVSAPAEPLDGPLPPEPTWAASSPPQPSATALSKNPAPNSFLKFMPIASERAPDGGAQFGPHAPV